MDGQALGYSRRFGWSPSRRDRRCTASSRYVHATDFSCSVGNVTCLIDAIETATPDPMVETITLCAPAPLVGCRQTVRPRRSRLTFRDVTVDSADVLRWSWTHGAATSQSDFGDPVTTTSYAVCLYDAPSGLFLGLRVPAGGMCGAAPCWKPHAR